MVGEFHRGMGRARCFKLERQLSRNIKGRTYATIVLPTLTDRSEYGAAGS